jgi:hypothetical protein
MRGRYLSPLHVSSHLAFLSASRAKSWSFLERSVYIMSIFKASFDFLAAEHSQRSNRREISPYLVVKRIIVIKSAHLAACRS